MAMYRTTRCPHCRQVLEYMTRTGFGDWTEDIGNPVEMCPHCELPYRTGANYWGGMSSDEKSEFKTKLALIGVFAILFVTILTGFATALLCTVIECEASIRNGISAVLTIVVVLAFGIRVVRTHRLRIQAVKEWKPDPSHLQLAEMFLEPPKTEP